MKKISFIIQAFLLTLCIFLTPDNIITGSYLISDDTVRNTMYVGENITEIEEIFEPPDRAEPGLTFVKSPSVRNTGNTSCTVRVRVDYSDSDAENLCDPLVISNGWTLASDGFYYWHEKLSPGDVTDPVFEYVRFRDDVDPETLNSVFSEGFYIYIYAESYINH